MKRGIIFSVILVFILFTGSAFADLYYPHADCTGNWGTEICVINAGMETVSGTLTAYDDNGNSVSTPMTLQLAPNARREVDVNNEFTNSGQIKFLVFDCDASDIVGYLKFFIAGTYRVAVPAVSDINSGDIYVPHIDSSGSWWTGISLVNTTSTQMTLTIEFNTGETKTITIPANGHTATTIAGLFDGQSQPNIKSAVVKNAGGVVGLELFGTAAGSTDSYLSGVLLKDDTATTVYYPHVDASSAWWTGVAAYNTSASQCTLTITSYDQNGGALGTSNEDVAANSNLVNTTTGLGLPAGTAWFKVDADQNITGFELFGTTDGKQLGGYTGVGISGMYGVFAKIEDDGWTGIALVNIEESTAQVTLTAFDDSGNSTAQQTVNLIGYQKYAGTIDDIFTSAGNATYVRYSSDKNVVGFQLNGSSDGMMLDALPGMVVSTAGVQPSTPTEPTEMEEEIKSNIDLIMGVSPSVDDTMTEASAILVDVLLGSGSTCPQVTISPENLFELEVLPDTITASADYGSGCTNSAGSQVSGSADIAVTNLVMTNDISANFSATFNNIVTNGTPTINGSLSGSVNGSINSTTGDISSLNVVLNFSNMTVNGNTVSGGITLDASNVSLSDTLSGGATITFNNFVYDQYTISSGTVTITVQSETQTQVVMNLTTSQGPINLSMLITTSNDGDTTSISTTTPGTIGDYTVTMNNVTMDTTVCEDYPTSGTVTFTKGGNTGTVTFTGACNGTYQYSEN